MEVLSDMQKDEVWGALDAYDRAHCEVVTSADGTLKVKFTGNQIRGSGKQPLLRHELLPAATEAAGARTAEWNRLQGGRAVDAVHLPAVAKYARSIRPVLRANIARDKLVEAQQPPDWNALVPALSNDLVLLNSVEDCKDLFARLTQLSTHDSADVQRDGVALTVQQELLDLLPQVLEKQKAIKEAADARPTTPEELVRRDSHVANDGRVRAHCLKASRTAESVFRKQVAKVAENAGCAGFVVYINCMGKDRILPFNLPEDLARDAVLGNVLDLITRNTDTPQARLETVVETHLETAKKRRQRDSSAVASPLKKKLDYRKQLADMANEEEGSLMDMLVEGGDV